MNNPHIGHENNNIGNDGKYNCKNYSYIGYCKHYDTSRCKLECDYAKTKQKEENRLINNPCFDLVRKLNQN